jgi:hypothetical protein
MNFSFFSAAGIFSRRNPLNSISGFLLKAKSGSTWNHILRWKRSYKAIYHKREVMPPIKNEGCQATRNPKGEYEKGSLYNKPASYHP